MRATNARVWNVVRVTLCASVAVSCGGLAERAGRPELVTDFRELFDTNCAGCHGVDGRRSVAQPLNDPLYLALVSDARLRDVISHGVPGTSMTAFRKDAGGTLTNEQVIALVEGMRRTWGSTAEDDGELPAYSEDEAVARGESRGDRERGRSAYVTYCLRCHGPDGRGGPSAGSVVDRAFLVLTSDQSLRTTIITGRREEGIPDWREDVPGRPMKPQEVSDVVAWISAHRENHD